MKTKLKNYLKSVLLLLSISSCATSTYNKKNTQFYNLFNKGEFEKAASILQEGSLNEGKDQILYLLDSATAYFEAENYQKAIDLFSRAERLTEYKDFTSVSEEAISLMSSDAVRIYRPMDYERIMINLYLALSYLMLGKTESAMVECRRINNLVYKLKTEGLKNYEESAFAWYLSAAIYESEKRFDSARIDYNRAKSIMPASPLFKIEKDDCANCGTVILIYSEGVAPKRIINPNNKTYPMYKKTYKAKTILNVYNEDNINLANSYEIMDIEETAIKNLNDRLSILKQKKLAATAIKGGLAVAAALAADNTDAGIATFMLLDLISRTDPDTRSWASLPRTIQIARFNLAEGERYIKVSPSLNGKEIDAYKEFNFKVERNKTTFLVYRYLK